MSYFIKIHDTFRKQNVEKKHFFFHKLNTVKSTCIQIILHTFFLYPKDNIKAKKNGLENEKKKSQYK